MFDQSVQTFHPTSSYIFARVIKIMGPGTEIRHCFMVLIFVCFQLITNILKMTVGDTHGGWIPIRITLYSLKAGACTVRTHWYLMIQTLTKTI